MKFRDLLEAKQIVDKDKVIAYMIKKGNNPKDAEKLANAQFDYVVKTYPNATVAKVAEIIVSLDEAVKDKPYFGLNDSGKTNYAVKINGIENDFPTMPFGRQIEYLKKVREFKDSAKKGTVGAKGKATMPAVKSWVKENNPSEFYATWQKDSSSYKDDSVTIYFK